MDNHSYSFCFHEKVKAIANCLDETWNYEDIDDGCRSKYWAHIVHTSGAELKLRYDSCDRRIEVRGDSWQSPDGKLRGNFVKEITCSVNRTDSALAKDITNRLIKPYLEWYEQARKKGMSDYLLEQEVQETSKKFSNLLKVSRGQNKGGYTFSGFVSKTAGGYINCTCSTYRRGSVDVDLKWLTPEEAERIFNCLVNISYDDWCLQVDVLVKRKLGLMPAEDNEELWRDWDYDYAQGYKDGVNPNDAAELIVKSNPLQR